MIHINSSTIDSAQIYGFIVPDAENVPENGGKDLLGQKPALLDRLHEEFFNNLQLAEVGLLAVDDLRNGLEKRKRTS